MRGMAVGGVLLLAACVGGRPADAAVQWWTESGLVKVMRDATPGAGRELRLQAMRGEVEWGQVVLRAAAAGSATVAVSAIVGPDGSRLPDACVSLHPVTYVHVARTSGNAYRRPADWPEILPVGDACDLPAGANQAVYLQVRVPAEATAGRYGGTVTVTAPGEEPIRVPVVLSVWPLTLPTTPTMRSSYYIWWEGIEKRFGLQDDPVRKQEVLDRFFWFLVDHRLCPMSLPCDIREADRYMADPRVNGVRLPYLGTDAEMAGVIRFVRDRGWLDKCFYYMLDEPAKRSWGEVHAAANRITGFDPLMDRLGTIQPEANLLGKISIWCPNVENVYLHDDRIALARARGEEVWWYTCAVPLYPYPTFLLDDDAIAPRLLSWMQARYDLTGSLYINTIHWGGETEDPWREGIASPELRANNDGLLMYTGPGRDDPTPVTGVRLEAIRDGIEDFELLQLLRQAATAAARRLGKPDPEAVGRGVVTSLASQVVPDARNCRRGPRALLAARRAAANATLALRRDPRRLERLLARPPRVVAAEVAPVTDDKFAVALRGTPTIDGKLDEADWGAALAANAPGTRTLITRFRNLTGRIWPSAGTSVVSLYDDEYVYFGFICEEPDIKGLRFMAEVGELAKVDRVAVALMVQGRPKWFIVTADGAQFEGDLGSPQPLRRATWAARPHFETDGYTVELALPRRLLDNPGGPELNLFRYAAPGDETLYFVSRYGGKASPGQMGRLELR